MGNQYLTGNNDGIIPEGDEIIWTFRANGRLYNPVSVNERVFVVSTDNHLYCLSIHDGTLLWKYRADSPLTRMVVVYHGKVYLPAGRFLYCIDEETGEVVWARRDQSFGFYGTPTVAKGKIFYGNRKGFFSRELANGHIVWENRDIYTYGGFPSYWNGMVLTVSKEFQKETARLVALNESDGSIRWSFELPNVANIYSPVVYGERIYLAFGDQISIFEAETGKKLFEKVFPAPVSSHPVFSQGRIFLSLESGSILQIDPENGEYSTLYTVPYGTQFAVVGSYLFIPVKERNGGMVVVDAPSGTLEKEIAVDEGEPAALTVGRGIVFLPTVKALVAIGKGSLYSTEKAGSLESEGETAVIKGEVKDRETGKPLSGKVKATTKHESGFVINKEKDFTDGAFEIEVPKKGETDLSFSSKGYTFETITLPNEEAVDDLSTSPLELSLSKVKKGEQLVTNSIHYRVGSANIEPNSLTTLNTILTMMQENPQIRIEIAGHTDSTGSKEFNMRLSQMRAESVASWLIQNGVSSKRISVKGYGDTRPIEDNSTEEGRRKNRRTEIVIVDDQ